MQYQRLG
jgi:hypothetical protein